MAEALCSVFKQPAMIAPNAPIDRIDIAFIICFLVHRKLVFIELSAIRSKSQPRASHLGSKCQPYWRQRQVEGVPARAISACRDKCLLVRLCAHRAEFLLT